MEISWEYLIVDDSTVSFSNFCALQMQRRPPTGTSVGVEVANISSFCITWECEWNESNCYHMEVSWNRGTPKIIHFNRIFHYKPSILGIYGNLHISITVWAELLQQPRRWHMRCVIWLVVDQPSDQKSKPGQWSWSDAVDHRFGGLLRPRTSLISLMSIQRNRSNRFQQRLGCLGMKLSHRWQLGRPAFSSVVFPDPLGPKMQVSLPALKVWRGPKVTGLVTLWQMPISGSRAKEMYLKYLEMLLLPGSPADVGQNLNCLNTQYTQKKGTYLEEHKIQHWYSRRAPPGAFGWLATSTWIKPAKLQAKTVFRSTWWLHILVKLCLKTGATHQSIQTKLSSQRNSKAEPPKEENLENPNASGISHDLTIFYAPQECCLKGSFMVLPSLPTSWMLDSQHQMHSEVPDRVWPTVHSCSSTTKASSIKDQCCCSHGGLHVKSQNLPWKYGNCTRMSSNYIQFARANSSSAGCVSSGRSVSLFQLQAATWCNHVQSFFKWSRLKNEKTCLNSASK